MAFNFENTSILIALKNPSIMKVMVGVLKVLRFQDIDQSCESDYAFEIFKEKSHDIVITELDEAESGSFYLAKMIRDTSSGSPNINVPIILSAAYGSDFDIDQIREAGFSDLLVSPYSVDDIKTRLSYIIENYPDHVTPEKPEHDIPPQPPLEDLQSAEDDETLVKALLGHYMKHHESVLQKLRFAQDATVQSIQEVRNVGKQLESRDNTNLHEFSDFETMWAEIIDMFLKGGVSEDDIFKIEDVITNIPADIKKHYTKLTQQDKSFLTLIESMNHEAYRKARSIAIKVQSAPNPMTGLTPIDYKAKTSVKEASFVFRPSKKS